MKIGVLGTGVVGQNIAEKLSHLGHQVMIGTRNKETTLAKRIKIISADHRSENG